MNVRLRLLAFFYVIPYLLLLTGCQTQPAKPSSAENSSSRPASSASTVPTPFAYAQLKPAQWAEMPNVDKEHWMESWPVWLQSCQALKNKPDWQAVCTQADAVNRADALQIRDYWQTNFNVYAATQADGRQQGMVTGYYQPVLQGAKTANARFAVPLYGVPPDLITVHLSSLFPELKNKRVRGRVQGQTLVPYFSRAEIEQANSPLAGQALVWVEDAVEAFFLQVQGSGVVMLENEERLHIGYADQNGHPYQSIGKVLVERGEMTASEASMQSIKAWGKQHPEQLQALLNSNPSYVFFKVLPAGLTGPLGALGVPLSAERSIAIDPFYIPLGAPVYLSTALPKREQALQQLMMAQDTGGAIKGGVRADVYWGEGEAAGQMAGAMRQPGQLWVWLPKTFSIAK